MSLALLDRFLYYNDMEQQLYYKVVRSYGEDYRSALLTPQAESPGKVKSLGVIYKIGEWTKAFPEALAQGFGLLVFKTREDAQNFLGGKLRDFKTFTCEVARKMELPDDRLDPYDWPFLSIIELRQLIMHAIYGCGGWPDGSCMFEEVKLVEEVLDTTS